jgi:LacI family transcriptional regulator
MMEYPLEGEWNDYDSGVAISEKIAALDPLPDAMFVFNDLGALGLQDGLLDRGIRVPDDIGVMGLDDIELAARARVPLSTVRQPMDAIGARALDAVLGRIQGGRPTTRQLLAPTLVVRSSCGALVGAPP